MLRGQSLRSIAMDWNERGVKSVGGGTWQGSMIRWVLMSPRARALKTIAARSSARLRGRRSSTAPLMILMPTGLPPGRTSSPAGAWLRLPQGRNLRLPGARPHRR